MIALGWMDEDGNPADPDALKTPQQGAATQVWAATSPQLQGLGAFTVRMAILPASPRTTARRWSA